MNMLKTLGRYEIEAFLGSGSHATVYRARDTLLNRVVALKVLKSTLAANEEIAARFLREAQTAANLIHPQIAWVLDLGETDGLRYIAIRYIEGKPLDKLIEERGRLIWPDALQVITQIGSALEFAHERGIIHRDIKPQNILFSPTDGAVLTDFGLVKAAQESSSSAKTRTDAVLGTPQYIAPELWGGQPASQASDQYALACVFVEMLTGQPLYAGKSLVEIIGSHMKSFDLQIWGTWPEDVPPGIDPVLQRALAREPEQRFADIHTFVDVVKQINQEARQAPSASRSVLEQIPRLVEQKREPPSEEVVTDAHPPIHPSRPDSQPRSDAHRRGKEVSPTAEVPVLNVRQRLQGMFSKAGTAEKKHAYQLVISAGPMRGKAFSLTSPRMVVGRNPGCDILIDDLEISRKHAIITQTTQGYMIEDLRSTNGTFINNQQIRAPRLLNAGDEIKLGKNVRLIFQKSDPVH
jgi:serine/threonine-protein kinase